MDNIDLIMPSIGKREFMKDVKLAEEMHRFENLSKKYEGYIVLLSNSSFQKTKMLGGTKLSDFECDPVYQGTFDKIKHFAQFHWTNEGEKVLALHSIYKLRNSDKKKWRGQIKYFPPNTYVYSVMDLEGLGAFAKMELPFIQNDGNDITDNSITFLHCDKRFAFNPRAKTEDYYGWGRTIQTIIERIVDISDSFFVAYRIEKITYLIPISPDSTKTAFRTREKGESRRTALAHTVKDFTRKDGTEVDRHMRGVSDFTMEGRKFTVVCGAASWEKSYKPGSKKSSKRLNRDLKESKKTYGDSFPENPYPAVT